MSNSMPSTIIITGVPGSGKTTVLQEALKASPTVTYMNYGDAMLEVALMQHIDRDTLRKLPLQKQQEIGLLAATKMAKEVKNKAIVDTHALIQTPFGYCPGIPQSILQILKPQVIIAIESDPQKIFDRRSKDTSRKRDSQTVEEIASHQALNRAFLASCSTISGALLTFIQNN